MEFGILGPLEVRDGAGGLVRVPGAKERALLADLVVHAGRVVSVDRLVEDLWADQPPGNPANTLQGRVSALRRALGPVGGGLVVTQAPGYVLEVEPEGVDAGRFERLVAAAGAKSVGLLGQGLGLWRGPALVEFADLPWAQVEAARLEELRLGAVERLVALRLVGGDHSVVGELEGLVVAHPTRERLRGLLMLAYTGRGGRPMPWGCISGRGWCWRRSWGSIRRRSCSGCTSRSWSRTRPWRRLPPRGTCPGTTCPNGSPASSAATWSWVSWPSWWSSIGWSRCRGRVGRARPVWRWSWPGGWWAATRTGCGWSSWPPSATRPCLARRSPPWSASAPNRPSRAPGRSRRPSAWPPSWPTRRCCWSWTTASTWSRRAPSWPGGCSRRVRGCGCWPPAARSWACPGRRSGRSHPWASRRRFPTAPPASRGPAPPPTPCPRPWSATTRCGCSPSGRPPPIRASPWMRPAPRWWPSCAGAWTGCPWPSSWPPQESGPCPRPSWPS